MILLWICLSFLVGLIGSDRNIGFLGSLFISLLLSPLIGLIFTLISKSSTAEKTERLQSKQLVLTNYLNYKNTRESNPEIYSEPSEPSEHEDETIIRLSTNLIPNSEIGEPIIHKGVTKSKTVKEGKLACRIQVGDLDVNLWMPFTGKVVAIHDKGDFLLLNDSIFIAVEQ
ncbi:MAG: hypothetical protein ACJA1A_001074 [Saprospiraceae bacterium]|jgi:hypothetical protein